MNNIKQFYFIQSFNSAFDKFSNVLSYKKKSGKIILYYDNKLIHTIKPHFNWGNIFRLQNPYQFVDLESKQKIFIKNCSIYLGSEIIMKTLEDAKIVEFYWQCKKIGEGALFNNDRLINEVFEFRIDSNLNSSILNQIYSVIVVFFYIQMDGLSLSLCLFPKNKRITPYYFNSP